MAIKGKSRSRSKPRAGARAPRAVPVEVKAPLFLRKRVQVSLAFLAGVGAMIVLIWATNGVRVEHRHATASDNHAKAVKALGQWKSTVDTALSGVQFDQQQQTVGLLAALSSGLGQVKNGVVPANLVTQAKTAEGQLKTAADALHKVDLATLVSGQGLQEGQVTTLIDSQGAIIQDLQTGEQAAGLIQAATGAGGHAATSLVARAKALVDLAQSSFADAYSSYVGVMRPLGLIAPPGPPGAGQLPGQIPGSSGS